MSSQDFPFHVFKYSIRKSSLDSFLKGIAFPEKNYACLLKVSPREEFSHTIQYIKRKVSLAYSFHSIRGVFIIKSPLSLREIIGGILEEASSSKIIKRRKYWYEIYVEGIPAFVAYVSKSCWRIFLPGAPTKPQRGEYFSSKKHPLYSFLMEWPEYEDSLEIEKDPVFCKIQNNFLEYLRGRNFSPILRFQENTQQFFYKRASLKNLGKAFSLYYSPCNVFSPETHTFLFRRKRYLNLLESKEHPFFFKRADNSLFELTLPKGSYFHLFYDKKIEKLAGIEEVHNLASYLQKAIPSFTGCTSYCQKALLECDSNDENTTLSYGHNSLKERRALPTSSIYLYYGCSVARVFIYSKKLIVITVEEDVKTPSKNTFIKGLPLLNLLQNLISKYVNSR